MNASMSAPATSTVPPSRNDYGWVNGKPGGKGK